MCAHGTSKMQQSFYCIGCPLLISQATSNHNEMIVVVVVVEYYDEQWNDNRVLWKESTLYYV